MSTPAPIKQRREPGPDRKSTGREGRTKTGSHQGAHKKTNDRVFEAKRADYDKKLQAIDKDLGAAKTRMVKPSRND